MHERTLKILENLLKFRRLTKSELLLLLGLKIEPKNYQLIDKPVNNLIDLGIVSTQGRLKKAQHRALIMDRQRNKTTYADLIARIEASNLLHVQKEKPTIHDRGGGSQILLTLNDSIEGIRLMHDQFPGIHSTLMGTPWVVDLVLHEQLLLPLRHQKVVMREMLQVSPSFFQFCLTFPNNPSDERELISHIWVNIPGLEYLDQQWLDRGGKLPPTSNFYLILGFFLYRDAMGKEIPEKNLTLLRDLQKEWNRRKTEAHEDQMREAVVTALITLRDLIDPGPFSSYARSEILPFQKLEQILMQKSDPIAAYLHSQLSPETQDLLRKHGLKGTSEAFTLRCKLRTELNRLLQDEEILYQVLFRFPVRFRKIYKNRPGYFSDPVTKGRRLLEAIYPSIAMPRHKRAALLRDVDARLWKMSELQNQMLVPDAQFTKVARQKRELYHQVRDILRIG